MMKLDKESIEVVKKEEEIIQQISYILDSRWNSEMNHNIALAIYLKRRNELRLVDDEE